MKRAVVGLLFAVVGCRLAMGGTSPQGTSPARIGAPSGQTEVASLPAGVQGVLSATVAADDPAYRVASDGARYLAVNARHGLAATMGPEGFAVRAGSGEWQLRMTALGRGAGQSEVATAAAVARLNRVEIDRGSVVEWWVNGPLGVEQGWTVPEPPLPSQRGPLTLALAQSGSLRARADADQGTLAIVDGAGRLVLRYAGLTAFDARGRELPARFEVAGDDVRVRVDDAGAAYPLRVDPWVQAAVLTASDGATNDFLGVSVAVSRDGSTVVAGARGKQVGSNAGQGAAYVFVRPTAGWSSATQTAVLTASDGVAFDQLGYSVAVSGDGSTVVAGPFQKQIGVNSDQGAVYVFVRPAFGWTSGHETARLTAAGGAASDELGKSVAVSADGATVVAGAYTRNVGSNLAQGTAYVFVKPVSGWANGTEAAALNPSDGASNDFFGYSVGVSGDGSTVVAGADGKDIAGNPNQGAVYVFVKPGSGWSSATETAELIATDGTAGGLLGWSTAVSGDGSTVAAGARGTEFGPNVNQGKAYVFVRPGSGWVSGGEAAGLTASDGAENDYLGNAVAISSDGSTVVAGAFQKQIGTHVKQGATYVFAKPGSGWASGTETAKLTASDGAANDQLGCSVSVSGDGSTVVAGALQRNTSQGAAYLFSTGAATTGYQGLIPMAADNIGKLQTYWQTTVWASQDVVAQATLSLCATNNAHPAVTAECRQVLLPQGVVVTLENAWQGFQAQPPGGFLWNVTGITPDQMVIFSRTYTPAPSGQPGTLGQGAPSLLISQLPAAGTSMFVPGHVRDGFRTNVGLFDATQQPSDVLVRVHDGAGTVVAEKVVSLPGFGWQQLNDVFAELGTPPVTDAYVEVFQRTGEKLAVYSSVVDNTSGDPTTFLAKTNYAGQRELVVPVVAHLKGYQLTHWVSDLTYLNASAVDQSPAELMFLPYNTDNFTNSVLRQSWFLAAGEQSSFLDIVLSSFGVSDNKGSLLSMPADPHLIWARTFNDRGAEGTAGQEFPAIFTDEQKITGNLEGVIVGLSQSAANDPNNGYRSSLGLLNTGTTTATFHVELFDDQGNPLGAFDQDVPAMSVFQIDKVFQKVTLSAVANGRAKVTLTQGQGFAYSSITDNQTGDPTTEYATIITPH
ncbi:MAG: FG-GAP repeat protein [Acidobacteriia bacterium]|nr:FG-GAP repeat protein [Terriglobia bacterium]